MSSFKRIAKNMKYFLPLLIKVSPWTVVFNIVTALLGSLHTFLWIYFPKLIIEQLVGDNEKKVFILAMIVIFYAVSVFIIKLIINILDRRISIYARKADFEIERLMNSKIMQIDYFNIEDPVFFDKITRAKKGMNEYSNGIYSFIYALHDLIEKVITAVGVIGIVVFSGEYLLIIVSVIGIIFNVLLSSKIQNNDKNFNDFFVRYGRRTWYFNTSITAFRVQKDLRLYNSEKMLEKLADKENNEAFEEHRKFTLKQIKFFITSDVTYFIFSYFLALMALAYSAYTKNMTIAVFTMLFSSVEQLQNAVSQIIFNAKHYYQECKYQEEFIDLMEQKSVFDDGVTPIKEIETIEFKNVSFKYPRTENYVLKDLSFKIDCKKKISLVGLNGSGKTTIIKLLCRFYKVTEGEILVNGTNINNFIHDDYMKLLSVVFQDFMIISFSIKSNVAIVDDNQPKLYNCFERAQVLDKVLSLPDKEKTYINKWFSKQGIEFSGGEMQKFAIARSLYKDSDLVVLDEPTSALDPVAEAKMYYDFKEIVGEKLTLFISHRLSSCVFSDYILVLDGARIVEEGTHKELMKNKNGLYHEMFSSQAKYYQ